MRLILRLTRRVFRGAVAVPPPAAPTILINPTDRKPAVPNLLSIHVSPRGDNSASRTLSAVFVDEWRTAHLDANVVHRDLVADPLPFVDLAWIGGAFTPPGQHSPETAAAIAVSDELVRELQAADHLLIGTPMYNFTIPAALKAWIDQVVRVGLTVSPDNVGLLTGKRATIILASGGDYRPGSPVEGYNLASSYLRQVLGFIGITDVEIVLAGQALAGQQAETAVAMLGTEVSSHAKAA